MPSIRCLTTAVTRLSGKFLEKDGHISFVLPYNKYDRMEPTINQTFPNAETSPRDEKDFAYVYYRYIARGLAEGWFKPHPQEVIPGGVGGVKRAQDSLVAISINRTPVSPTIWVQ
jgi:NADPH2:quinone reductase